MFKIISAIIIVTFVWGYLWVPTKIGLGYISPFFFTALRLFTGTLPLFLIQFIRKKDWLPAKKDWKNLITISFVIKNRLAAPAAKKRKRCTHLLSKRHRHPILFTKLKKDGALY
ncbi:DMT family transporter [Bacillus siamensis]|uniref:DMT family transporter n=1 Tax=Bacillus siamensis TaxID=659243 RepID=UPI0006486161|nr:DMT family transporter [Bacillus siamensis]